MKAMVLCAGYGTRLGDLTRQVPKPMLPLGNRCLLEYIVRNLVRHRFDEIAINLHFMPEVIQSHFGAGSGWGARLCYSHEPELLGTAGGLKKMASFLRGDGPFLVHYGDILTDQDFTALLDFHRQGQALATLLVHRRARSMSALTVDDRGRILSFCERPREEDYRHLVSPWVFSGVALCEAEILDLIPPDRPCDLPRDLFTALAATRRLLAFPLTGARCAIDSPERYAEAVALVQQQRLRIDDPECCAGAPRTPT